MKEKGMKRESMAFHPGFDLWPTKEPFGFEYGQGVFGPEPEIRRLDDIRASLANPQSRGPEEIYAIVMDVGVEADREEIVRRNLLFGAVTYASGLIGREPARSQGHIHAVSASCGSSTPEIYEIWDGEAVIYIQESASDNPGKCYAVYAHPGDVVIVPPGCVHAAVNAGITKNMSFGAWCVRDYGFDYDGVRRHGGIAYFPYVENGKLAWRRNPAYKSSPCEGGELIIKNARTWEDFSLEADVPIYTQFQKDKDRFLFVSDPGRFPELWAEFTP